MADESGQLENELCREWAERWLSRSGFSSYLDLCDINASPGFEIHERNLTLGWALTMRLNRLILVF